MPRDPLSDFEGCAAVRAFHAHVDLDQGFAYGAQDVGRRRSVRLGFGRDVIRDLGEVKGGRPAVEADIAGLDHVVVLVDTARIEVDLCEQSAKQPAAAAAGADKEHDFRLRR